MSRSSDVRSNLRSNSMPELEMSKHANHKDAIPGMDLWTEGLICAFEYVRGRRKLPKTKAVSKSLPTQNLERDDLEKQASTHRDTDAYVQNGVYNPESLYLMSLEPDNVAHLVDRDENLAHQMDQVHENLTHQMDQVHENRWVPIGWKRISELVQQVQAGTDFSSMEFEFSDKENDVTVAELAAPYWERPAGPVWWCHVDAGHPHSVSWLSGAQWLHPAVSVALRDESRLISERMKFLLYEVPVRVAGGLLFELLGQSAGDPSDNEDDIPVVLRSWQAQNFLVTALHVKGSASNVNVLGVMEVQELLAGGGYNAPKTAHELIGHLASRLARWDDRFYRKYIFGAADETELMFVNRRNHEDMHLFGVILNQEVKKLSRQVIRVKWSLHAREEIIFELLQQLRGNAVRTLLEGVRGSTREMIDEQEAVRGRLFTIQDVMQSSIRAWLQDQSLQITHNLTVFGGCGLVLTVITGLFGINVDGMPGAQDTPYAFALFTGLLILLGIILIVFGVVYLGLKRPVSDAEVEVRKLELEEVVKMFQHEAETHAQVRHRVEQPSLGTNVFPHAPNYVIIQ